MTGVPEGARTRRVARALAAAVFLGIGASASIADDTGAPERGRLNPLSALEPSDVSRFRDRPLFTPSRQPPPVVLRAPERPTPIAPIVRREPPKVRLTGVVQGNTAPMAILQRSGESATATVRVGDNVDGWLVISIDSLAIVLQSGAHEHAYKLFGAEPSAGEGPEAAPAAKPERRIAHPVVDIGRNLRAKPQAQP